MLASPQPLQVPSAGMTTFRDRSFCASVPASASHNRLEPPRHACEAPAMSDKLYIQPLTLVASPQAADGDAIRLAGGMAYAHLSSR